MGHETKKPLSRNPLSHNELRSRVAPAALRSRRRWAIFTAMKAIMLGFKGGAIAPAEQGQSLTMKEILFENKVKPTEAATDLARKLTEYSRSSTSSGN